MIGIDTNVLVRYLTQDDQVQAEIANKFIKDYEGQPKSLFINNMVLSELIWVLERGYKYGKLQIVTAIRAMLSTIEFDFEYHELIWLALAEFEKANTGFADIMIGKVNELYNCSHTITFDNAASKLKEFQLISTGLCKAKS